MSRLWLRLLALVGGTLLAASAVCLALVVAYYEARLTEGQRRTAEQIGSLLEDALENAMLKRDIPGLEGIVASLGKGGDVAGVMILDPARRVRFASDAGLRGTVLAPGAAPGPAQLRVERAVPNRAECSGCHGAPQAHPVNGTLVIDLHAAGLRREALLTAAGLAGLGLLATLAASVALGLGLRRIVLRPLRGLADTMAAFGRGEMGARATVAGAGEIAALASGFNDMAGSIEAGQGALTRAERAAQALIDALPDAVRVIGPDFRILRANAAYAAQVGGGAIVGQPCHASSHRRAEPCPHTLQTCPVAELRAGRAAPLTFRDRHIAPAGRQVAVEVCSAPMEVPGIGTCIVESIRDLDEQARLSQRERLSEIGLLATGVAHEIHNPLSSLELALAAMDRDLAAGQSARLPGYVALMHGEIARCLSITENLLRLGSAPDAEGPQLIEIAPAVEGVLLLLAWEAERLGLRLSADIEPGLRVLMPDADLRMALTNLALNAFHAMQPGGVLTITAARDDGRIALGVSDTGCGIAPEVQADIFLPFWSRRADGSTGRGLGLAITRAIATRAGGSISVVSAPGQGARFTLHFPDPDCPDNVTPS